MRLGYSHQMGLAVWTLSTRAFQLLGLGFLIFSSGTAPRLEASKKAIDESDLRRGDEYMAGFNFVPMTAATGSRPEVFGTIWRTYISGKPTDPPLLLLHELPGLREADVKLGARLAERFQVTMPLMFGLPGDKGRGKDDACGPGLFECNSTHANHPILADLRPIVRRVCDDRDCAIIGMCLTGTVPLWLMSEAHVVAIVMAQPSLPFPKFWWPFSRGIDISREDTAAAMQVAMQRNASIFMIRLRGDVISSHRSFVELKKRLRGADGVSLTCREDRGEVLEHSSLVWDDAHPGPSEDRFRALTDFLNTRLRDGISAPGDCP